VFQIGSLTKPITSLLLADMVLRGEVKLEDPAAKYLPSGVRIPTSGAPNAGPITLHHLATHTSGLPSMPSNFDPYGQPNPLEAYTVDNLFQFVSTFQLPREPGEKYEVTVSDVDPARGAPDAPITIVEFSDFKCPYCKRFVTETLEPLMADFEGTVKLVFRDYPILGQDSILSALAGGCANDQGKFWEFHDLMFANQTALNRDTFLQYATDLDMDVETFTKCFDERQHLTQIQADYVYAQSLGVAGAPSFFINGRFISGAQPYQIFADTINQELAALNELTPEPVPSS